MREESIHLREIVFEEHRAFPYPEMLLRLGWEGIGGDGSLAQPVEEKRSDAHRNGVHSCKATSSPAALPLASGSREKERGRGVP